ncbi:MAG TPA: hypothetical protein VKQ11_07760 [Candidatus Sulfotelmatobacter sp.]|nr:hypothetical protein [Candidatus Sulfotelmatobacter sp.]
MRFRGCSAEKELAQALKNGHWPEGCTEELRAHVAACSACSDLALVNLAFRKARSESAHEAPSVSSGLLWWRAQLRRRNAAAEQVTRPITIAQLFAWTINLFVLALFIVWQYGHGLRWASWCSDVRVSRALHLFSTTVAKLDWNSLLFVPSLGALALLSLLVVYLVAEKS